MDDAQKAVCVAWVKAHAHKWQVLNRAQWKYQFHEKTLVRFVEETQMREDEISLILEYLSSDDCIETLSLYDQTVDDSWKPTRAWLEVANKSVGSVHSVRLYHGLQTELSEIADGPYLITDGCAYKVSMTYYWRQSSVPDVPQSESGVSYSITGLSRDADTGLYTYAIEKRERVQQDVAEYFTSKSVFANTTEEYHLGVKKDKVDSTGKQASVGNGKVVRRKITKNQDCTSDVHNTTEIEQKVVGASESVSVSLTGTTKTTVNRNMPEKASTEDLDVGDRVENTETEGGLWNQTITTRVKSALTWLASTCRWTVFAHSHTDSTVQGTDPGFTHTTKASGGVIVNKKVSRTADGSYEVNTSTTTEQAVSGASETTSVGLDGTTVTTVNRNMPEKAAAPTEIGESVENSETEGGLWNQTIRKLARNAVTKISDACRKTIFAHSHSTESVQSAKPDFTDVDEASDGVIHHKSVSRTATGAYRVSDDTTTEKPVSSSSRTASMTTEGLVVRTEDRNMADALPDPQNVGETVTNSKTEGGLWNRSSTKKGETKKLKIAESCQQSYFAHQHSETNVESELQETEHSFERGEIVHKSGHVTSTGAAQNTISTTTAKPSIEKYTYTQNDGSVVHVVTYRNQQERYADYPDGAVGLSVSDGVNEFELHDGSVKWLTNAPVTFNIGDLKFIKHGKSVTLYELRWNSRWRRVEHRAREVQLHHICGDAYTDYLSDERRADPKSTESGAILYVKKLNGPYCDKGGNKLAEWVWVSLTKAGEWTVCDGDCGHQRSDIEKLNGEDNIANALKMLVGDNAAGGNDANASAKISRSLDNIALIMATGSGLKDRFYDDSGKFVGDRWNGK